MDRELKIVTTAKYNIEFYKWWFFGFPITLCLLAVILWDILK
jgi:hypothetical protein